VNIDETSAVLRVRRDLTGESFNDGTIAAWCEALGAWPGSTVRTAVIAACRDHQRVAVAHVAALLPQLAHRSSGPPIACELCDGCGTVPVPTHRAHNPRTCTPTEQRPCDCHAVEPCRCSAGEAMRPVLARIIEHNDRTRPRHVADDPRRLDAEAERLDLR
jgi:hypothetical protein